MVLLVKSHWLTERKGSLAQILLQITKHTRTPLYTKTVSFHDYCFIRKWSLSTNGTNPKSNSTLKQELTVTLQVPRHYSFQEVPFVVESSVSSWAFNFSIILLLVSLRNNWHSYKTKMTETSRTVTLHFELFVPLHYQYQETDSYELSP